MNITKITSIKFVKPHIDKNSVFEIFNPNELLFTCGEDHIKYNNIPIHKQLYHWREVFASDTQIILTCEIKMDNNEIVTGSFDMDELMNGKLVKIE